MTSVPQNTGNIKNNVNPPKREQEMPTRSPLKHNFTLNIGVLKLILFTTRSLGPLLSNMRLLIMIMIVPYCLTLRMKFHWVMNS